MGTFQVMSIDVPSSRGQGRPRKTKSECIMVDIRTYSLGIIDRQNREAWKFGVEN